MEKTHHVNGKHEKCGYCIIKAGRISKDKQVYFLMIKGQFKRRHKITNVCTPINRTSKCMSQKLMELKGEIEKYTLIDILTLFSVTETY